MNEQRCRGFELITENMKKNTEQAIMPLRATKTSAGYDLYAPYDIQIKPQDKLMIWTDLKAYMKQGEMAVLDVTSSMGGELDLMLANTIGIIDADYHNNKKNEGNLGVCLRNLKPTMELKGFNTIMTDSHMEVKVPVIKDLREENIVTIEKGKKIGQVIFVPYLPADNCNSENERTGGWGSTNK